MTDDLLRVRASLRTLLELPAATPEDYRTCAAEIHAELWRLSPVDYFLATSAMLGVQRAAMAREIAGDARRS